MADSRPVKSTQADLALPADVPTANDSIVISAPARLHFGLFSIGQEVNYQFGGVGVMIENPRTIVRAAPSSRLTIAGACADAARGSLETWWQRVSQQSPSLVTEFDTLPLAIDIEQVPPRHCGFGTGTQLALSIATAAMHVLDFPPASPEELAALVGRGKRSAIGSYGFHRGGFLVDRGKHANAALAPLDFQTQFPAEWPIVTARLISATGLFGGSESLAFAQLPPTSKIQRAKMIGIVRDQMIPGLMQRDYERFAKAVYEFGYRSGSMFAPIQQGAYNGQAVTELVSKIRDYGVTAVGQSSWGPCVFAVARDDEMAWRLRDRLRSTYGRDCEVSITSVDNRGVQRLQAEGKTAD